MKKGNKILIYFSVVIVLIIMLSLFYYSMREALVDYFFENDPSQRAKITSATGDQAQIMIDLAKKQLAKEQADIEIRENEVKNKSLFKELSGSKATVKSSVVAADVIQENFADSTQQTAITEQLKPKKDNRVQNGYVVINCDTGGVIACPHHEVQTGTSPLFYQKEKSQFLIGRCLDVSIDVKTFCP